MMVSVSYSSRKRPAPKMKPQWLSELDTKNSGFTSVTRDLGVADADLFKKSANDAGLNQLIKNLVKWVGEGRHLVAADVRLDGHTVLTWYGGAGSQTWYWQSDYFSGLKYPHLRDVLEWGKQNLSYPGIRAPLP